MINIPHMKRSNKIQSASSRGVKAELREGGVSNDVNCPRSHSELLYFSHVCAHTHTHTHTWAAISLKHSDRYWQPASLRVWSFQIIFMCDFKDQRRGGCEVLPRRKPKSSHLSLMNLRATPGRSPVIAVSQPLGRERSVYSSVQQFGPVSGFLLCALFSQTSSQIHGVQEQNKTAPPFFKTNICVMGSSQGHGSWHLWLCLQGAARLLVSGSREDNLNQTLGYSVQDDRWKKNNLVNVFTCLKL